MLTALRHSTPLSLLILILIKYSCAFSISRSPVPPEDESTERTMPSQRAHWVHPTSLPLKTEVNYVPELENNHARHYKDMLITVYNTLKKFDDDVIGVANTRKLLEEFLIIRSRRGNNYRHGNRPRYRRFRKSENGKKSSFLKVLNRILLRMLCGTKNSAKKKKRRLKLLLRYLDGLMILESRQSNMNTPSSLISPETTSIQITKHELEQNTLSSPVHSKQRTMNLSLRDTQQLPLKLPRAWSGGSVNYDMYRTTTPRNNNIWHLLRAGNVPKTRKWYPSTFGQNVISSPPTLKIGPNFPHETNSTPEESKRSTEHHEFRNGRWITNVLGGFFSDFLSVHEEDDDPEPCHNLQRRNGDQGTVREPDTRDFQKVDCVRDVSSSNLRRSDESSDDVPDYVTQKTHESSLPLPDDPTEPTNTSVSTYKEKNSKKK